MEKPTIPFRQNSEHYTVCFDGVPVGFIIKGLLDDDPPEHIGGWVVSIYYNGKHFYNKRVRRSRRLTL